MTKNYYYTNLSKLHQSAYYSLYEGLSNLSLSFPVPRLDGRELFDIYFLMRLDHPELFWASGIRYKYYEDSAYVEVIPEYLFDKKKIKEHQKALSSRVEKLARGAKDMIEADKIKYIHDFVCQNVYYDKLKKQYSHEIIGPLGQGVGVCEGIAKSVKILCDVLNIQCIIAISEANPEKGIKYRHAWNVVKINGKYYHLDATFDNSLGRGSGADAVKNAVTLEDIRYDYFLLSDKQIFRDHEPVIWKIPECNDGDNFYYKQKKLSFTTLEDIRKRASQAVKKGKTLTFHWRGDHLTRQRMTEILHIIEDEASAKNKHALVQANVRQGVIRVSFTDDLSSTQLIEEEANEGEKYTTEE